MDGVGIGASAARGFPLNLRGSRSCEQTVALASKMILSC